MFIYSQGYLSCQMCGVDKNLSKNPQSKDEALEALDFIVNVLKEHERDLDKLINELATVTEQMGDTGELNNKVEKIEEKICGLQKEVKSLVGYVSGSSKHVGSNEVSIEPACAPTTILVGSQSVTLRCKQWEDFQALAANAQTLSFMYKEEEKLFQAEALKGSQIITYNGPLPKFSVILKSWLSKQLNAPERGILEGALATR